MDPFPGFNSGTLYTPVPNPCFGPLLEQIQDVAELKVVLRGLWLLHRQRSRPKRVSAGEFLNDYTLLRGLAEPTGDASAEIRRGLRLAVDRGIFLSFRNPTAPGSVEAPSVAEIQGRSEVRQDHHERGSQAHHELAVRPEPVEGPGSASRIENCEPSDNEFYMLNTESNRSALERMSSISVLNLEKGRQSSEAAVPAPGERPNIFVLYEENIGMLSPILAEELKEAEELYPEGWLEDAFRIAVTENKRSWRYISGILQRWAAEGKDEGKYGRKDDGKSGRHSQKDNRQKHIEDYERRWGGVSR